MTRLGGAMRLLLTCLLAVGVDMPNPCPCTPLLSDGVCAATINTAQEAKKCCCSKADGKHCGMTCCQGQAPAQSRSALPTRSSDSSVTCVAKAIALSVSNGADVVPTWTVSGTLFDLTSHSATPTLRSQHICLQI